MRARTAIGGCLAGVLAALAPQACGGSTSGPATPACAGVCSPSDLSRLDVLAGQPGAAGWVDGTLVAAHFSDPWTVRGDGQGHLYVADRNMIRAVDIGAGSVHTLAGVFGAVGAADGAGAQATFNLPSGLAYGSGQLYLTDTENHTIRKIDIASANVTTIAGTPRAPGDTDGTGSAAAFKEPEGLAFDGAGRFFIADTDNNTIRAMDLATLTTSTLAGSPTVPGSTDGAGPSALFYKPKDVALDGAGNLYVADALNESVRKVVTGTGQVSTLHTFTTVPQGLAADGADVIVSLADHSLVRVAPDGTATPLAGSPGNPGFVDGPASATRFNSPAGMWNDGAGTLYVADDANAVIRTVQLSSGTAGTFAGAKSVGSANGTGSQARFANPQGVVADATAAYVADTGNDVIRKINLQTRVVTTLAGAVGQASLTDGPAGDARFNAPAGLALDGAAGRLYVADTGNRSIRSIDLVAGKVTTLALTPMGDASFEGFDAPTGLALAQGKLYVTDFTDDIIAVVDPQASTVSVLAGQYATPGPADGAGSAASFYGPQGICTDGRGALYVADNQADSVRKIDIATATVTTIAGHFTLPGSADGTGKAALFDSPVGVAANALGDVFVSDSLNDTVRHIKVSTGAVTTVIGSLAVPGVRLGPLPGQLTMPSALALTPAGALLVVSENTVLIAH
jgi:sugar lactone lactonase YvrE